MYTIIIVTMIKAPFRNAGRGGKMTEKRIKLFFLPFSRILSNIVAVCRIGGGSRQRRAGVSCVSEVQVTSCLSWPNIQVMNWTQGATRHTSYNNTTSATTTTTLQWNNQFRVPQFWYCYCDEYTIQSAFVMDRWCNSMGIFSDFTIFLTLISLK